MHSMTPKERLLSAIRGKPVDRVPWSPCPAYWWEAQPAEFQKQGQLAFLEQLGADPLLRGFGQFSELSHEKCAVDVQRSETKTVTTMETPVGTLTAVQTYVKDANTWFLTEHPVKTEDDFKTLTHIMEHSHLKITADLAQFESDQKTNGERALTLPLANCFTKTPFQSLVEYWVGTEELVYALADYPEVVEACLAAMSALSIESVKLSATSSAEGFIFWEDSSTTNISPAFFAKYTAPEINAWGDILHGAGKFLVHHACGHLQRLIPLMAETKIDAIEAISPPPTGNIELADAAKLLPDSIALIGGIEPTVLLNSTLEALETYVRALLRQMDGRRYVLANSDSCPPGVSIEKFRRVSSIVKALSAPAFT
jgi:uroporphyrinogen-III decarboxylase